MEMGSLTPFPWGQCPVQSHGVNVQSSQYPVHLMSKRSSTMLRIEYECMLGYDVAGKLKRFYDKGQNW